MQRKRVNWYTQTLTHEDILSTGYRLKENRALHKYRKRDHGRSDCIWLEGDLTVTGDKRIEVLHAPFCFTFSTQRVRQILRFLSYFKNGYFFLYENTPKKPGAFHEGN